MKYISEQYLQETKTIKFPKSECEDLKKRLEDGKSIHTIRVGKDYGKYDVGDVVKTEWGDTLRVIGSKKIEGIEEYEFYSDITKEQLVFLNPYEKLQHLELIKVS